MRQNYITWVANMISRHQILSPLIIDIGTGASLIHPIIVRKSLNAIVYATETDEISFENASNIIIENNLI